MGRGPKSSNKAEANGASRRVHKPFRLRTGGNQLERLSLVTTPAPSSYSLSESDDSSTTALRDFFFLVLILILSPLFFSLS